MITYSQNGFTLQGVDDKGVPFSSNPQDSNYFSLLQIMGKQQDANNTNNANQAKYMMDLHNAQTNIDAGRTQNVVIPTKPRKTVVSDSGISTPVDFDPPLPDIVYPTTTTGAGALGGQSSGGVISGGVDLTTVTQQLTVIMSLLMKLLSK